MSRKTRNELLGIAKKLELSGYSSLSKADLIDLLCQQDKGELKRAAGLSILDRHSVRIGLFMSVVGIVASVALNLWDLGKTGEQWASPPNDSIQGDTSLNLEKFEPTFDADDVSINYQVRLAGLAIDRGPTDTTENEEARIRSDLISEYGTTVVDEMRAKAALEKDLETSIALLKAAESHAPRNPAVTYDLGVAYLLTGRHAEAKAYLEKSYNERSLYVKSGYPELLSIRSAMATATYMLGDRSSAAKLFGEILNTLRVVFEKNSNDHPDEDWPTLPIGITAIQSNGQTTWRSSLTSRVDLLYLEGAWATALLASGDMPGACTAIIASKKSLDTLLEDELAAHILRQGGGGFKTGVNSNFFFDLKLGLSMCHLDAGEMAEARHTARDAYRELPQITVLPTPAPDGRHIAALVVLSSIALQSGNPERAIGLTNRTDAYLRRIGESEGAMAALSMGLRALALVSLERFDDAELAAESAVTFNKKLDAVERVSLAHESLAIVLALRPTPDMEAARRQLALAFDVADSAPHSPVTMASLFFWDALFKGDSVHSPVESYDFRHAFRHSRSLPHGNVTRSTIEDVFRQLVRCEKACRVGFERGK